jgi:hypothetical protein
MGDFLRPLMIETADVLKTITGLQVFAHPPQKINPPGGAVSYPDGGIDYGVTYGGPRGAVRINGLSIVLVASKVSSVDARDTVAAWVATSGTKSVPAKLEAHAWESCDDFTVTAVEFDAVTIGAVDYLAAMFKATVMISGGE